MRINEVVSRIAIALNPIVLLCLPLTGAVIAGHFAPHPVAMAVGAITGLAVALPLCGSIGLLASIERHTQRIADEVVASVIDQREVPKRQTLPIARSGGHATGSASSADDPDPTAKPDTGELGASPLSPAAVEARPVATNANNDPTNANESERALLERGQFAQYHLAKAKRLMAMGNSKEAAAQAAASLAHQTTEEARALRRAARNRA